MIPGLAFFYGGMVRSKSVLNMLMMVMGSLFVVGILWVAFGYSIAFGTDMGDAGLMGSITENAWLTSLMADAPDAALPAMAFVAFQAMFACITVGLIAIVRWIVLPRVTEGTYSVHSWFYMRKWTVALATEVTLETLSSLFATVYLRTWYRLMGAKIGKDAEISTNLAGRYDLVDIGEKCFIADEVILGVHERYARAHRMLCGGDE
jgi:hypothetical protein